MTRKSSPHIDPTFPAGFPLAESTYFQPIEQRAKKCLPVRPCSEVVTFQLLQLAHRHALNGMAPYFKFLPGADPMSPTTLLAILRHICQFVWVKRFELHPIPKETAVDVSVGPLYHCSLVVKYIQTPRRIADNKNASSSETGSCDSSIYGLCHAVPICIACMQVLAGS